VKVTVAISVVIPVHNGAAYLGEALASSLGQNLAPLEIVVVDDGSEDPSGDVARAAGAVVLHQPTRGAAAARNAGVRHCRGSLVAFLDADDRMMPDRLSLQATRLSEEPELDGVLGQIQTFTADSDHRVLSEVGGAEHGETSGPVEPGWLPSTMMVRRSSFLTSGGFDEHLWAGEFVDWIARCRHMGLHFAMLDHVVATRRAHAHNTSRDTERIRRNYLEVARLAVARHRADECPQ
jgi:glycosyltransferase involved in cell wall biosynthesis